MVDRLKKSLEQLDAPYCPKCTIEMSWTRSSLADAVTVVHVFICPGCSSTAETRSTVQAAGVPPKNLSAPRERRAA
jgi:hypothetical protein